MFLDPGASLRLRSFSIIVCAGALFVGCDDGVRRLDPDAASIDAGPRDATADAADAADGGDAATVDAGAADGGTPVTCVAGTAVPLIDTVYVPGGRMIFDAEANIDGVFVAATIQDPAVYPNYERTSAFLSSSGAASAPVALSGVSMAVSTSIAVTRSSTGFIAAFDETADLGVTPKDLWVRTAVAGGGLVGTNAVSLIATPSAESNPDFIQTTAGFAGVWQQAGVGPVTAVFDTNAVLVGTSHVASGTLGSAGVTHLFTTGTQTFVAYLGADSHVRSASIGAGGTVGASSATISVLTSSANFAVASGTGGAGLAYESLLSGAMTAVAFRALAANGTSAIAERTLHGIDERGSRPSAAALAGGYLVLFRLVPTSGTPKLRLVWVNTSGDSVSNLDLVDNLPSEAQYAVRVSPDGEVYVLYQEAASFDVAGTPTPGATLKALRLVCE